MVSTDLAGQVVPIGAVGGDASLVMPTWSEVDKKVLCPPGFERVLADLLPRKAWGDSPGSSQMRINAAAFSVDMRGNWLNIDDEELPYNFEKLHPKGEDVDSIKADLSAWFDRFLVRVQAILGQPLSLADPVHGVIDACGVEMLTWIEVGGRKSWLDEMASGEAKFPIVIPSAISVLSERIIDKAGLSMLIDITNGTDELPLPVELFGDARIASRRKRFRQAISDLGTAAEAIIVSVAPQLSGRTLGGLVASASEPPLNIQLPPNAKHAFAIPRNDAVHRAITPSPRTVERAAEIVDDLIRQYLPGFSPDFNTSVAARQPYQSITIIAPPR
jgi:hypothetical protein